MKNDEISLQLEVLDTGEIKFRRGSTEHNNALLDILAEVNPDKVPELEEFFKGSEDVIVLEGEDIFCG